MKAHQLLFQNLIDINPRNGIIRLDSRRMALISTEALGILRRDLVGTLGMERAKGFLMRYGFACGFHDGDVIQTMYDWESRRELLLSGPSLHTLEGIVTVEVDQLEFDDEKVFFSGYWSNSYEAEEHIRHFGYSERGVCWSLVGYVSGFLKSIFGKDVLVKEVYCQGKKDERCYFVAKTIEQLDEQERDELRYYQAESLVSELDRVYKEIHELNQTILFSEKVQRKLTNMMLDGKSLSYLISYLSEVIGRSIAVERSGLGEVFESCFRTAQDQEAYQNYRNKEGRDQGVAQLVIDRFELKASGLVLGNLVMIGAQPLTQQQQMIIERAISVCTIQMFHQRSITQSIWKKKEDFFEEILDGKYDEAKLTRRAMDLDIQMDTSSHVLAVKVLPQTDLEEALNYVILKYPQINAFLKRDAIVIILSNSRKKKPVRVKDFANELKELLEKKFPRLSIYIGTGREIHSIAELGQSYQDALRIAEFMQIAYPSFSTVATFEQLEPIFLFLKGVDQQELLSFCKKKIGKLIEQDQTNQSHLLLTLKTYLDYNGNLHKTAKDLHLSITGLRYRLNRIETLLDVCLKDGTGCFNLHLAVQIYFALQLITQQPFLK